MTARTWEYAVRQVAVRNGDSPDYADLDRQLREMGGAGWELVSTVALHDGAYTGGLVMTFERPGGASGR